jgi:hypothetical protein
MIEGDAIAGVRGEMNALVESLVSQDFVGEAEVNKRESVRGYIKDPPKAGSCWEKRGKNQLNWFSDRLNQFPPGRSRFTNLLSRRLDRIQNRLSRERSGWTGFRTGWTGFQGWKPNFEYFEENKSGVFVGSKIGFFSRAFMIWKNVLEDVFKGFWT